jgi:methyl-accepting chemotaxis protein
MGEGKLKQDRAALGLVNDKLNKLLVERAKHRSEQNTVEANAAIRVTYEILVGSALLAFALGFMLYRRMSGLFGQLNTETERLATAAVEGRLQTRADTSDAYLECRPVMEGFNRVLDAVCGRDLQGSDSTQDHRPVQRRLQHHQEQPQPVH